MPLWLTVALIVVAGSLVTLLAAFLIDRSNHA
jgi:hypothetical protein